MKRNNKFISFLQLHLIELKYNFIIIIFSFLYIFFISYYFSNQLIYLLINVLINKNMLKYFIFTNITEIFSTNISISLFITIFILIQFFILQIWFFFSAGFFKYENYFILKVYLIFFILNFLILNFIFIKIIPNIFFFFLNLNF